MKLLYSSLACSLAVASAASTKKDTAREAKPCTITSPTTGSFFDLTGLVIPAPAQAKSKHPRDHSWNATGYDVGYNFTVNICGPVIEGKAIEDGFVGVEKSVWRNVSAYYKKDGKNYALGLQNEALVMRGRKLVLNYTDGSPCDDVASRRKREHAVEDLPRRALVDGGKTTGGDEDGKKKQRTKGRRKSTVISMLCDKDPLAPTLQLSFVGTMDECTYFFEGRSNAACATADTTKSGSLNPSGVFGVIATIAILVYFVGGCVYNRAVLQQRGWQQVPNYNMWAGILAFFRDIFIILASPCARLAPSRRGYSRVNHGYGAPGGRGRARGESSDAENRLIDELNEEWED